MKSDPMELSRHHAVNAVASSVEYTIVALEKLRDGDNEMDDIRSDMAISSCHM